MQANPTSKPQSARQIAELAELVDQQGGDPAATLTSIEHGKSLSLTDADKSAVLAEVRDRREAGTIYFVCAECAHVEPYSADPDMALDRCGNCGCKQGTTHCSVDMAEMESQHVLDGWES